MLFYLCETIKYQYINLIENVSMTKSRIFSSNIQEEKSKMECETVRTKNVILVIMNIRSYDSE